MNLIVVQMYLIHNLLVSSTTAILRISFYIANPIIQKSFYSGNAATSQLSTNCPHEDETSGMQCKFSEIRITHWPQMLAQNVKFVLHKLD